MGTEERTALRRELGAHLRAARAQVTPADVGLNGGGRRRAPGLRREEVAALAGVSVAWYTWLEQGRVATSRQVVEAVCAALRMPPAARRHALALAGFLPEPAEADRPPDPGPFAELVEAWAGVPAAVADERFDVLAANAAYRGLWGDPAAEPGAGNILLRLASSAGGRARPVDPEPVLRGLYEQFRSFTGHSPEDPRAAEVVRALTELRPDAAHWWACRSVRDFAPMEVAVADAAGRRSVLTFSLLRPVSAAGAVILAQTPAGAGRRF
ncbi:helix-turn-helix domain-containing protein [Nocardiopsis composta]|uniref:Transcriptional regulator with XRE-family HTH domain n=1 Tax=Nocardiopsis composta TaxID=157465 RepID=A0A7W8QGN3_9ACTN|nr:helix-turn-helix domain-containing protein [Nocardiopsis composta]MBB5430112.1 transcriptional regulator with XRE-family HTH domain [Nocardiopsis composta]